MEEIKYWKEKIKGFKTLLVEKLDNLEIRWKKGVFYKTVISDLSDLKNVFYDILVFFSPSGIESLFKNFPNNKRNLSVLQ